MTSKKFDLEERTINFAKKVLDLIKSLPRTSINIIHFNQVVRSSGSIGANYIEANEALGKKDFYMKIKISRKESKETKYWLELILYNNPDFKKRIIPLVDESVEYIKMFSSIINKAV